MTDADLADAENAMEQDMSIALNNMESFGELDSEMEDLENQAKVFETKAEAVESKEFNAYLQSQFVYYCGILIIIAIIVTSFPPTKN